MLPLQHFVLTEFFPTRVRYGDVRDKVLECDSETALEKARTTRENSWLFRHYSKGNGTIYGETWLYLKSRFFKGVSNNSPKKIIHFAKILCEFKKSHGFIEGFDYSRRIMDSSKTLMIDWQNNVWVHFLCSV